MLQFDAEKLLLKVDSNDKKGCVAKMAQPFLLYTEEKIKVNFL